MVRRLTLVIGILAPVAVYALQSAPTTVQTRPAAAAKTTASIPRAIRRDVPLTNAIRRAYDAGTRDMSGRPGPNYWQLKTDYDISVRLDPATQTRALEAISRLWTSRDPEAAARWAEGLPAGALRESAELGLLAIAAPR